MKLPETQEQYESEMERVIKVARQTRLDAKTIIKHLPHIEANLKKNPNFYVQK